MQTWGKLSDLVMNIRALEISNALFHVFSLPDVQDELIRLNTDEQLFSEGINSQGVKLSDIGGDYSAYTVIRKQEEGLPYLWVTLYDTGEFYGSFRVIPDQDGITIEADTIKDGQDLTDRWGDDILGLTDESIADLILYIVNDISKYVNEWLLR